MTSTWNGNSASPASSRSFRMTVALMPTPHALGTSFQPLSNPETPTSTGVMESSKNDRSPNRFGSGPTPKNTLTRAVTVRLSVAVRYHSTSFGETYSQYVTGAS